MSIYANCNKEFAYKDCDDKIIVFCLDHSYVWVSKKFFLNIKPKCILYYTVIINYISTYIIQRM
ncbi:MAG: hypothetical protein K0S75_2826 [Clostridia bacterium]|jgi:hypothetical protein|nr:hypothetical protein [Clostridia bacterium]